MTKISSAVVPEATIPTPEDALFATLTERTMNVAPTVKDLTKLRDMIGVQELPHKDDIVPFNPIRQLIEGLRHFP